MGFKNKIKKLFGIHNSINEDFFDDLTDTLIEGDIGAKTSYEIIEQLQQECKKEKNNEPEKILEKLKNILCSFVEENKIHIEKNKINVLLVLGVNGVGKTTSVAKLANFFKKQEQNVLICAADTFRAAAIEQLKVHGENLGVRVVSHQSGSDPAAVVFDSCESCSASGGGVVLVDTAGRLHNKENLVRELKKIDRIAKSKASEGCYKKILVIDSTTGQNALRQAEVFNEAIGVDFVILTKYDSTAKGGILVSLGRELNIPCGFICTGETYDDIAIFDTKKYIDELIG